MNDDDQARLLMEIRDLLKEQTVLLKEQAARNQTVYASFDSQRRKSTLRSTLILFLLLVAGLIGTVITSKIARNDARELLQDRERQAQTHLHDSMRQFGSPQPESE